jgi:hypothetical protein
MPEVKTCGKCKIQYPSTTEFFYHSRGKLSSRCRSCLKAMNRSNYHKPEVKERVLAQHHSDEYRQNAAAAARKRRRNTDHRDKVNERNRIRYRADQNKRQKILDYMAERYRRIHPLGSRLGRPKPTIEEKRRRWRRTSFIYRHRKTALPITFTTETADILMGYFNHSCAICGCVAQERRMLVFDHWIPLSHPRCPGTVPENIIVLCHSLTGDKGGCNNIKRYMLPDAWLRQKHPDKASEMLNKINAYFEYIQRKTSKDNG